MSMNRSEGSSLLGTAPVPSISRYVIEDLVVTNTSDNAPQTLYSTTPVGSGLRSRFMTSSGTQHCDVTARRRVFQGDTASAKQLCLLQIEKET